MKMIKTTICLTKDDRAKLNKLMQNLGFNSWGQVVRHAIKQLSQITHDQ